MKSLIGVILLALLLQACASESGKKEETTTVAEEIVTPQYPIKVDVQSALNNKVEFNLSEFGKRIQYIPLKGFPDVTIAYVLGLEITDNDLFVFGSHNSGIKRFTRAGEYLNDIGRYGNGPNELSPGSSFFLNPDDSVVHVHRNFTHNDIWYNYEGKAVKSPYVNPDLFAAKFVPLSSSYLLRISGFRVPPEVIPEGYYEAAIYNRQNEKVACIPSPLSNTPEWRSGGTYGSVGFWYSDSPTWYKGLYHFQAHASDTIYEACEDSLYAKYILEKGKYARPPELINAPGRNQFGDPYDFIVNQCVFESDQHLLFRACFKGNEYIMRMNKETGMLDSQELFGASYYNKPRGSGEQPMIKNDIDHGVDFYPHFTNRQGNIWVFTISALDYIEQMEALQEKGQIDLKDISNEAVRVYQNLTEESNPILMLLEL